MRARLLLATALSFALMSGARAATCITDASAGFANVVGNVNAQTGSAVTAAPPSFGSVLAGATLTTTAGNAVTNVGATTAPVSVITGGSTVNALATQPGGVFFQQGQSDVVMATNPPGIRNVPVISGTLSAQNVVTAVNQTTAPFLTGATLATTSGNVVVVTGVTTQSGNVVTGITAGQTPVVNALAVSNSGASAAASALGCGPGAVASAPGSVALGAGSIASAPNTVSVGAPGAERRITNVAPGINPTDAVNVSQLQGLNASFDQRFNALQQQLAANTIEARRGIAAAAALAPTIMPTRPGRTVISVSGGFYMGEAGVGIGISHRLNLSIPAMLFGSYANGGSNAHVTRIGGAIEF